MTPAEKIRHLQGELTPRIVIVGGGFAGLEVAKALGKAGIGATIIDRHNHHLFQPLLYQVATAALSAPDIAEPIRKILGRYPSIQVLFGEVAEIELEAKALRLKTIETPARSRSPCCFTVASVRRASRAGLNRCGCKRHQRRIVAGR